MIDLIESMADAGAPIEALRIAARAVQEQDDKLAAIRGKAAAKKRRQRARKLVSGDSDGDMGGDSPQDSTVDSTSDNSGTVAKTPSPDKSPPDPQKLTPTRVCAPVSEREAAPAKPRRERRKATYMPDGWEPGPLPERVAAIVLKWPPGAELAALDSLKSWAASCGTDKAKKADWNATWHNWIRRCEQDREARKPGWAKDKRQGSGWAAIMDSGGKS